MAIFTDGFESGDFTAWTSTTGTPTVVGSPVREGSYSMQVNADAEYATKDLGSQYAELFMRAYVRFESLPTSDAYVIGVMAIGQIANWAYKTWITAKNVGGTDCYFVINDGASGSTQGSTVIALNTQYCVELQRRTGSGVSTMYINSVNEGTLAFGYYDAERTVLGAESNSLTKVAYLDSCIVDSSLIGCISAGLSIPVAMHHYNRINKIIRG